MNIFLFSFLLGCGVSQTILGANTSCVSALNNDCIPLLNGDVTGPIDANIVTKLQSYPISSDTPNNGANLAWNGIQWLPVSGSIYYGLDTATNSGTNTVTLGPSATTLGATSAVAIGDATIATGTDSIAIGRGASAIIGLGGKNVAIGALANVYEIGQVAIGYNASTNFVGGGGAIAIGRYSISTNTKTIALGDSAKALGQGAIAIGDASTSSGDTCVAIAKGATCTGLNAVAIGPHSIANTTGSVAIGWAASSNSIANAIAIGQAATAPDAQHSLALVMNSASISPSSVGISVNANPRILLTAASLYSSTTSAGPTVLTVNSAHIQVFTIAQTVQLPNVSTLELGFTFKIINRSGGNLIVQSSGSNTIITLSTLTSADFVCVLVSGTTNTSWTALGPITAT